MTSDALARRIEEACARLALAGRTEVTAGEVADELGGDIDPRQVGRHLSLHGVHGAGYDRVSVEAESDGLSRRYHIRVDADSDRAARCATLFRHAPHPVVEVEFDDGSPIVTAVNAAFESVFGFAADDVLGRDSGEVVLPADRREEGWNYKERVREGERVEAEVRRRTADGVREFRLRVVPLDSGTPPAGAYAWYVPRERVRASE